MDRVLIALALAGCSGSSAAPDARPDARPDAEPEVTPPEGVVAWFRLNGEFNDAVNHVAFVLGGSTGTFSTEGLHNGGGYLDGVYQRVLIDTKSNSVSLDFPGPFSVGMWIRPEQIPIDYGVIAERGEGPDSSFALNLDSQLRLRYDSQGSSSLAGNTQLPLNEWSHVALTFDGTTKRTFVDGVLDASGAATSPVSWDRQYIVFGAQGEGTSGATHYVTGTIDDIMLFDRALSAQELAALAAQE